jgi:hypothetical protein
LRCADFVARLRRDAQGQTGGGEFVDRAPGADGQRAWVAGGSDLQGARLGVQQAQHDGRQVFNFFA